MDEQADHAILDFILQLEAEPDLAELTRILTVPFRDTRIAARCRIEVNQRC